MDREDGVFHVMKGNTTAIGIPYADYYCDNCDVYYQWVYGVPGLRNVTKGENTSERFEELLDKHVMAQYDKDFDIKWVEKG